MVPSAAITKSMSIDKAQLAAKWHQPAKSIHVVNF